MCVVLYSLNPTIFFSTLFYYSCILDSSLSVPDEVSSLLFFSLPASNLGSWNAGRGMVYLGLFMCACRINSSSVWLASIFSTVIGLFLLVV